MNSRFSNRLGFALGHTETDSEVKSPDDASGYIRISLTASFPVSFERREEVFESLMPKSVHQPNRILERLPTRDAKYIVGMMERISPPLGTVVAEAGVPPRWVHFPCSAVLSSMVVLQDGSTVEGSTIGNEGMDGLYLLSSALANPCRINVQVEGELLRLPAAAFKRVMAESPAMSHLLMRYCFVSIQRGSQNGACIQHHTIEERMCRWLLETAHRKGADRFHLTQEFLADMLGVRRQSVNLTARILQSAKLIKYTRGEVIILDRPGLEEASCECFRVTSEMYEQAMKLVADE